MSKLKEQLKKHEGLRLKPYKCTAGRLTIGYGRNIDDVGITQSEAETMLNNDIQKFTAQVYDKLTWVTGMDEARRDVLINMAFNLGIGGLLKFKNTLEAVRIGDYYRASQLMLESKWAKQVGNRAVELAKQMDTGKYAEGYSELFMDNAVNPFCYSPQNLTDSVSMAQQPNTGLSTVLFEIFKKLINIVIAKFKKG